MEEQISIGLLIGGPEPPNWFNQAIEQLLSLDFVTIEKVVIPYEPSDSIDKNFRYYFSYFSENRCWAILEFWQRIVDRYLDTIPELKSKPLLSDLPLEELNFERYELQQTSEYRVKLPEKAVSSLSEVDIAIHNGVGILEGSVLNAPTFGVWGIHHGDIQKYRGGPPGFWEYVNGESTAKVTLQQYTEELDGGNIILEKEVNITPTRTWREVRRKMCRETAPIFADAVDEFSKGNLYIHKPATLGQIYSRSDRDCKVALQYLKRSIPGWLRTLLSEHIQMYK